MVTFGSFIGPTDPFYIIHIILIRMYGLTPLPNDPYSKCELISYSRLVDETKYNIDQMPLLAARVSTAKEGKTGEDPEADLRLMTFLASNGHTTPFEHQTATFRVVAPLFVFREWHRHRTQSYNEMSMRYTSDPVGKLYYPLKWRKPSKQNKQGSSEEPFTPKEEALFTEMLRHSYYTAIQTYKFYVDHGVAKEQARYVVPVGNFSEMYATANLLNWRRFCKLRLAPNAQYEIRVYAEAIDTLLSLIYPKSWEVLKAYG